MVCTAASVLPRWWLLGATACTILLPWDVVQAGRAIHEHAAVDPAGSIEVVNVAGSVELIGWDRAEIDVTGSAGDAVDRVDLTSNGSRSSVRVVSRPGSGWSDSREATLTIHLPRSSAVSATSVSSAIRIEGVRGDVNLQTVNGDVKGEVGGNLHASTVSGGVHLSSPSANRIEVKSVNGEIQLSGGGGDVDISTISGDAKVQFGAVTRGRFKSISGDLTAELALAPDAQIDGESVSGSLTLTLAGVPAADFDIQTLSGTISNCFGPKPVESRYGPGSRLSFGNGDGHGHVHIDTKSGDVHLCAKDLHGFHSASRETGRLLFLL